eukprot:33642-Prorocentrum_minimum.AAC.1
MDHRVGLELMGHLFWTLGHASGPPSQRKKGWEGESGGWAIFGVGEGGGLSSNNLQRHARIKNSSAKGGGSSFGMGCASLPGGAVSQGRGVFPFGSNLSGLTTLICCYGQCVPAPYSIFHPLTLQKVGLRSARYRGHHMADSASGCAECMGGSVALRCRGAKRAWRGLRCSGALTRYLLVLNACTGHASTRQQSNVAIRVMNLTCAKNDDSKAEHRLEEHVSVLTLGAECRSRRLPGIADRA